VLLGVVVTGLLVALALPWGGGQSRFSASGATLAHHAVYVVQPGDSLWSIAQRLDPSGDPRPIVDQLTGQTGSSTVVPGEHLLLP
jgi:hypothetical protein